MNFQPFPIRGLHVRLHDDQQVSDLVGQLPAVADLGVNLLIAEINYDYAFESHPEVREEHAISRVAALALARASREHGIRPIPQLNCLGHQSWEKKTFGLLRAHPELDETPGLYPDNEGIYCRSWCPRHPDVNALVFDLMDELLELFQADAFHVGMDEVFMLASEHCPRCHGADPGDVFGCAVEDYYGHLVKQGGVEMWMWGDRLLDNGVMGYGEWESATNGTHTAIGRVPRDVVICDWHYESNRGTYPSIPFFLEQGFRVLPAGWREPRAVEALIRFSEKHRDERLLGYLATTWGAVQPGDVSSWEPLLTAMQLIS